MTGPACQRIERLLGAEGLAVLGRSCVAVVGLGAVGSYAVEALARARLGRLRVVDFDVVHPSNINRQLYATCETIGRAKVELARQRIASINPDCRVETLACFADKKTAGQILAPPVDLCIDAIDSVGPKVQLLAAADRLGVPVVSAMGAALRTDPRAIQVSPLSQTRICPLARQVRRQLGRLREAADPICVWSDQPTADLPDEAVGQPESDPHLQRGRPRRTLGSLPTLTGIFGLVCANTAMQMLLGDAWPGQSQP